jgi:hypothetical protein
MHLRNVAILAALAACGGSDSKSKPSAKTFQAEPARAPAVGDTVVAMRPFSVLGDPPNPEHRYVTARVDAIDGANASVTWYTVDPGHPDLIVDVSGDYPKTAPLAEMYPVHAKGAGPQVAPGDHVLYNHPYESTGWEPATVVRLDDDKIVIRVDEGEAPFEPSSLVAINQTTVDALARQADARTIFREGAVRYPIAKPYAVKAGSKILAHSDPSWGEAMVTEAKGTAPGRYSWTDLRADNAYGKQYGARDYVTLPPNTDDAAEVGRYVLVPRPPPDSTHFWIYGRVDKIDGTQLTVFDDERNTRTFQRAEVVLLDKDRDPALDKAYEDELKRSSR